MRCSTPSSSLRDAARARNIRSIIFRLSPTAAQCMLASPKTVQVVQALQTHGFRVGCIGEQPPDEATAHTSLHKTAASTSLDFVHFGPVVDDSVYARAAQGLNVPLQRTLLVTDALAAAGETARTSAALHDMATTQLADHAMTSTRLNDPSGDVVHQLAAFAQSLLGVERCLDLSSRCFGPHRVLFSQVFYTSSFSFALVNLKPIVPGHVLIVPKRCVDRFECLDADEVADLWSTAQLVGKMLERYYSASALTFAIQDGAAAGQTVKHVHIHVLPRVAADFANNDDVYTEIEAHERGLHVDNERRSARSEQEMAHEAATLRALFL